MKFSLCFFIYSTPLQVELDLSFSIFLSGYEESLQACPGSPEGRADRRFFSLVASTGLSPIPKTGDLQLQQQVPDTPCRAKAENRQQSSQAKHRHKTVSFHIGTISPIRGGETGENHNSCQTVPITSSRVHESMMDTSLFSLDERAERETGMPGHVGECPNTGEFPELRHKVEPPSSNVLPNTRGFADVMGYVRKDGKFLLTSPGADLEECDTPAAKMEAVGCLEQLENNMLAGRHIRLNQRSESVGLENNPMMLENSNDGISSHSNKDHCQNAPSYTTSEVALSAPIASWESCDRGSASWVNESELSLWHLRRQSDKSLPHLESSAKGTNPLTSTMRHGIPFTDTHFGFSCKNEVDASTAMDISSVSMIPTDILEKQESCMYDMASDPANSGKKDSVANFDVSGAAFKPSEHSPEFSYERVIPSHLKVSRSFDSLQKFVEQENMIEQEDWLMSSLSESDLQGGRMSAEFQQRAMSSSLPEVTDHPGQHGILTELQQGNTSHTFPSTMCNRHIHSQHMVVQEGHKSSSTHKAHGHSEQDGQLAKNGRKVEVSPIRPLSADVLLRSLKSGTDSGYNTHSANVSVDVIDGEGSS